MRKIYFFLFLFIILIIPNLSFAIVATGDNNYPPHAYLNFKGEPEGFDLEVLNWVAKKADLDLNFLLRNWEEAKNSVIEGRAEILIGVRIN